MDAENLNLKGIGRQSRCSGRIVVGGCGNFPKRSAKKRRIIKATDVEKYKNANYIGGLGFMNLAGVEKSGEDVQAIFDTVYEEEEFFFQDFVMDLQATISSGSR